MPRQILAHYRYTKRVKGVSATGAHSMADAVQPRRHFPCAQGHWQAVRPHNVWLDQALRYTEYEGK